MSHYPLNNDQRESLQILVKALLKTYDSNTNRFGDQFEEYAHILKCKAYLQRADFASHFISGYEILLRKVN